MLHAGHLAKRRFQGVLVRRGVHQDQQPDFHSKEPVQQDDPPDERRGAKKVGGLWQVRGWEQSTVLFYT